ncbi:MAG: hypothetical protein AB7G34_16990 [Hyphomicrobiales bacterium]
MKHQGWFALSLLFAVLGIGYRAAWQWTAVAPTPADALREVSGRLLKVQDVSNSKSWVRPILEFEIARPDGGRTWLHIRNRSITLEQFRALVGSEVRARYSRDTNFAYEFFSDGKRVVAYESSYRTEYSYYTSLKNTAEGVWAVSAAFGLIGLVGYVRSRRRLTS